jgi:CRP-like cAMP-binding protein
MARRGRPPKYCAEIHKAIIANLEIGCSRTTAAELARINRMTLETWRTKYPAFNSDVTEAIARAKRRATVTITTAIQKGDVQAAFRYLALQERAEWQEERNINVNLRIREKAQRIADELGIPVETVIAEAEAVAAGTWDAWSPE